MPVESSGKSRHLIVFDLDGTLLEAESSWGTVNQHFGNDNRGSMQLFRRGAIDYAELVRRDIAAWPKPLHISRIREALAGWVLRPGVRDVLAALRAQGLEIALLTGGLGVLAAEVAAQLGIEPVVANDLVTDARGYLTGEVRLRVDPLCKEAALERLCRSRRIALAHCATVADSEMDASLLRAAGLGVLLAEPEAGRAMGVASVAQLSGLVELIGEWITGRTAVASRR